MDPCFFGKNHTRRLTTVMSFCTAVELLTRVARLVCVISAMSWPSVVTFRRMRLTTNKSLRCADSVVYGLSLVAFSLYPWVRMLGRCCSCIGVFCVRVSSILSIPPFSVFRRVLFVPSLPKLRIRHLQQSCNSIFWEWWHVLRPFVLPLFDHTLKPRTFFAYLATKKLQ